MKKIKLHAKKVALVSAGVGSAIVTTAVNALAVGTADPAVVTAMTTTSDNSVATLSAIAPIAITIFGSIFVWRIGKKVFKIISN